MTQSQPTWRYPRVFWTANGVELCERAAYYGTFIALRTYLLRVVKLGDVQAGIVAGLFGALLYLFPFFTGAVADRIGFRKALLLAFALLFLGYGSLGVFSSLGPVLVALLLIVVGGAFVKPVIAGTVAKSSSEASRARAFSIFYMVVNIGSFTGKTIVAPIRIEMGVGKVPFFSAAAALVALIVVLFLYWPREDSATRPKSVRETLQGMAAAVTNLRFFALILITAGFWAIQGQLYASMPDYVIRMAGETYKPEWYANVNPLVVVLGVVGITHLVRNWRPEMSIGVAMALVPLSSLAMASSHRFHGDVHVFGLAMHPITVMMIVGIAIQGLGECFLSPKYLEYASKQAPPGREGLYLGYAHLNTFFAWLFGFIFAGYMLRKFCPDPATLPPALQQQHALALQGLAPMPAAYAHAHYLWYAFALVGATSFLMLLLYIAVTRRRPAALAGLVALVVVLGGRPAAAATALTTTLVASGFSLPVFVTSPPGDTGRLFVVEQRGTDARGRVKIIESGVVLAVPFLITVPLATGNEQGLLGLAFAPDYATSRRFYIHYTDAGGTTTLARYLASATDPNVAEATPDAVIFTVAQPFPNHNGGWIAFGPDGYLYMALGDGGSGGDPGDRAQNIDVPLGKILRFDVSGAGAVAAPGNPFYGAVPGLDTIWSFGLRNPWRDSFDRATGDLIIADVGQNAWEEIDFAPASTGRGSGWNFGWKCYEGNVVFGASLSTPCGSCTAPGCDLKMPAYVYDHTAGRCAITGGYVYRGGLIPDLQGTYFFADFCGNQIYSGRFAGNALTGVVDRAAELDPPGTLAIASVSSFGEDAAGELYLCDLGGGKVLKIVPRNGVTEADMPVLRVATVLGDTLGATTPGNALTPGIVPFTDLGSRIRGVEYLRNASLRSSGQRSGNCLTSFVRLAPFDLDVTACVDPDSTTLTRTFVFRNTATTAQPLAYVDVIAPYLNGDADLALALEAPTATATAGLVLYDAVNPTLYITQRGFATGASFSMDADSVAAVEARVGADLPLAGRAAVGPARAALALGFDFGSLAAAAAETVVVVTRLQTTPPAGVPVLDPNRPPLLRVEGPMPFRESLQLSFDVPRTGRVGIEVLDLRGRRVRTLLDADVSAGTHPLQWDGRDDRGREVSAGLYFIRMRTATAERSARVVRVH